MNLSSTYTFKAPRHVVWDLLIDPTVVADCLPGCESLEPSGEDSYTAVLLVGIASITGRYNARVTLADKVEPESYRLVVDAKGRPGFVPRRGAGRTDRRHRRPDRGQRRRSRTDWWRDRQGRAAARRHGGQDDDGPFLRLPVQEGNCGILVAWRHDVPRSAQRC